MREILEMFPGALVVADTGEICHSILRLRGWGDVRAEVVYIQAEEAVNQGRSLRLPSGTRTLEGATGRENQLWPVRLLHRRVPNSK